MNRVSRISDIATSAKSNIFHRHQRFSLPKSLINPIRSENAPTSTRFLSTGKPGSGSSKPISDLYEQFADKWVYADVRAKEELIEKVCELRDELMKNKEDEDLFEKVLEDKGWDLFKMYSDGGALLELLKLLEPYPHLAMKVFNWRRRREDVTRPMVHEEYAKGINIAGRMKNLDLAVEIFINAATKRIKNTSTYNALMSAYMCNGLSEKCLSVFRELKQDVDCGPTLVTYNILILLFGRMVLVERMEAMFEEMKASSIPPNLTTYNNLIAGYLTAWMWDSMEDTFRTMKTESIHPDLNTHLLMLRGYAYSGNLAKMEETYDVLGPEIRDKHLTLIRAMICAYCKNPHANRVERIEQLLRLIPEHEYRPWLNVLLIRLYAQEDLVDQMQRSIDEAFDHNTSVNNVNIMRCIVGTYFRNNAVDRLASFVKRAEDAGWRICRSLYHSLLCLYALQKRIAEMEQVLVAMEKFNYGCSKRTFIILYKAYSQQEQGYTEKIHRVLGLMCKLGYQFPSYT